MKKINILLVIFFLGVALFTSCEKDADDDAYGGDPIIAFENASGSISEADTLNTIKIFVFMAKISEVTGTVEFMFDTVGIANPAVEGVDFELVNTSKTLTFAAGEYSAYIELKPLDNDVYDKNKNVNITLTTGSGASIGYNNGEDNTVYVLTITDNEHPLALVIGTYTVNYVSGYDGSAGSLEIETLAHPDNETQVYFLLDTWVADAGYGGTYTADDWVLMDVDIAVDTVNIVSGQAYADGAYGPIKVLGYDTSEDVEMEDGELIEGTFDANGNITFTDGMSLPFTSGVNLGYSFDNWRSSQWIKNTK